MGNGLLKQQPHANDEVKPNYNSVDLSEVELESGLSAEVRFLSFSFYLYL